MDSSYIMPFVHSVQNVFGTMLQLPVQTGQPYTKNNGEPSYDVSGIIGLNGDVDGTVALSFNTATAERIASLMTGMELESTHEDFADSIGELVNMIAGGAKAQFEGQTVNISCPSVVLGQQHQVFTRKDACHIVIPCECDCGQFVVEVSLRPTQTVVSEAQTGAATHA